jgi:NAD(P)H-flavin reductase
VVFHATRVVELVPWSDHLAWTVLFLYQFALICTNWPHFSGKSSRAKIALTGHTGTQAPQLTLFRGMLRQAAKEKLQHKLYLFYSNRRPEDAAFLDELRDLSQSNTHLLLVPSMSEMERSNVDRTGERGFINREMLAKHLPSLDGPIYYVAGPLRW